MSSKPPVKPRWVVGGVAIVALAVLMALEVVNTETGIAILTSVLAGLGLYEGNSRRKSKNETE
jgi:hypothetical protein